VAAASPSSPMEPTASPSINRPRTRPGGAHRARNGRPKAGSAVAPPPAQRRRKPRFRGNGGVIDRLGQDGNPVSRGYVIGSRVSGGRPAD
jgi:hypothetical protein